MGFFKQTIKDVPLDRQVVLLRVDYNVPLNKKGKVDDDLKIRASLPTIKNLLERGCKIVIISHLGRPNGVDVKYSLEPVAARLAHLLKQDVRFMSELFGDRVHQAVKRLPGSSILVLENLRFYAEEEANDENFARKIAESTGARYFVQDGFGVVHRAHASTSAITLFIPSVAGLLVKREYEILDSVIKSPGRPFITVLGGAKVSDKMGVIERLVAVSDKIIIGGSMANTFLSYHGLPTGSTKIEPNQTQTIKRIYEVVQRKIGDDCNVDEFIILPTDTAVSSHVDAQAKRVIKRVDEVSGEDIMLDIGNQSIERFVQHVAGAKTVIWNGTLGYAELPEFAHGSARIALALASQTDTVSVIGGGDTADFVRRWDGDDGSSFTHISTGGGASLDLISGKNLPGIESLIDAHH